MNRPKKDTITAIWSRLAPRFRLVRSEPVDETVLHGLALRLRDSFSGVIDAAVADRIALPEDYQAFLRLAGGTRRRGDEYGYHLFGLSTVISETGFANGVFDHAVPAEGTPWLIIGHRSDKHDIALCCDPTSPLFGVVVDCHDGHPWLGAESEYKRWPTFARFLASLD